ncbi:hypothetical protein [uncultured Sphaerotilus sp.]|uniref:hypothetical protein n=1 Tax=uncultured Sphaerotilus sp. TaxID=474984 RepID=UPI0030CA5A08
MHHAPALALTLPPERLWLRGVRALGVSALLGASGWLAWHTVQTGAPTRAMLWLVTLSSLPALWLLHRSANPVGCALTWHPDDAQWRLERTPSNGQAGRPQAGRIDCIADGTHWMLLRHSGRGIPSTWLCVSRRDHPARWHALRCAVFSPGARPEPAPASDE